jgi:hypothetical protein
MMEKNFLDFGYQIELNEKNLETYQELYEKALSKISFISIIYSLLALYSAQIAQYAIESKLQSFIFSLSLIVYLVVVIISIVYTVKFLLPIEISHLHCPQYFYRDIKEQYEKQGKGKNPETLNKYIQSTYLNEIEKAVNNNFEAFKAKRRLFYFAFNFALAALIPYVFCLGVVFENQKKDEPKKVEIVNLKSLYLNSDSTHTK